MKIKEAMKASFYNFKKNIDIVKKLIYNITCREI